MKTKLTALMLALSMTATAFGGGWNPIKYPLGKGNGSGWKPLQYPVGKGNGSGWKPFKYPIGEGNGSGWKPFIKPLGTWEPLIKPLGDNGLGWQPLEKPFGAYGGDIEEWISDNKEFVIGATIMVVAIVLVQPEIAALSWQNFMITATADGFAVGVSITSRESKSEATSSSQSSPPSLPVIDDSSKPPPVTAPIHQSDESRISGHGGHWVIGASVPEIAPRKAVTLFVNTDGFGHVWINGETESLALSFGPKPPSRPWTQDSTIKYETHAASEMISFRATDKMLQAMADEIRAIDAQKGYEVLSRNCTTEAVRVLRAGGIVFPKDPDPLVPIFLANHIRAFKAAHPAKNAPVYPPPTEDDWRHGAFELQDEK